MAFQIKEYNISIELVSGMHIGAGNTAMHIGGIDNEVIKDALTRKPYIPGSSLKGKVRALLEYWFGVNTKNDTVQKLFGVGAGTEKDNNNYGVTRLSFADSFLCKSDAEREVLTEIKTETAIDRKGGTAKGGSLRNSERVVAGVSFDSVISMKVFEGDDENLFEKTFFTGLKLLNMDNLGGAGSRGYGRVKITFKDSSLQEKFENIELKR